VGSLHDPPADEPALCQAVSGQQEKGVRPLAWLQGGLAVVNLVVGGLWLYALATNGCGGLPLLAGTGTLFVAGFLAAGGMWSLVYSAGQQH